MSSEESYSQSGKSFFYLYNGFVGKKLFVLCRSEEVHHFADNRHKDSQRVIARQVAGIFQRFVPPMTGESVFRVMYGKDSVNSEVFYRLL